MTAFAFRARSWTLRGIFWQHPCEAGIPICPHCPAIALQQARSAAVIPASALTQAIAGARQLTTSSNTTPSWRTPFTAPENTPRTPASQGPQPAIRVLPAHRPRHLFDLFPTRARLRPGSISAQHDRTPYVPRSRRVESTPPSSTRSPFASWSASSSPRRLRPSSTTKPLHRRLPERRRQRSHPAHHRPEGADLAAPGDEHRFGQFAAKMPLTLILSLTTIQRGTYSRGASSFL